MFNFDLQRKNREIRRLKNHAIKERKEIRILANEEFAYLYLRSSTFGLYVVKNAYESQKRKPSLIFSLLRFVII